jgi:hypothetical protein
LCVGGTSRGRRVNGGVEGEGIWLMNLINIHKIEQ